MRASCGLAAQVSAFLFIFTLVFPLVLSHFANCGADHTCDEPTWWVGPLLSFITVTSYVTLQQVARALEDPFVHPPNDLPANALQAAFNGRLLTTGDAIRTPADDDALTAEGSLGSPAPVHALRPWASSHAQGQGEEQEHGSTGRGQAAHGQPVRLICGERKSNGIR